MELADTQVLGTCDLTVVQVQVLSPALMSPEVPYYVITSKFVPDEEMKPGQIPIPSEPVELTEVLYTTARDVIEHFQDKGEVLSLVELCNKHGIVKSAMRWRLNTLAEKGVLNFSEGRSRGYSPRVGMDKIFLKEKE